MHGKEYKIWNNEIGFQERKPIEDLELKDARKEIKSLFMWKMKH